MAPGLDGGLAVIKKHRILETVAAGLLLLPAVAVLLFSEFPSNLKCRSIGL